jgi:hypothetical protein
MQAELPAAGAGPVVLGDERRVCLHDAAPRPVVDAELNSSRLDAERVRAALRELDEVLDCRATEAIERLVVVADDANVLRAAGEPEEDALLDCIGVLVLVDDDVLEAVHRAVVHEQRAVRSALKEREVDAVLAQPVRNSSSSGMRMVIGFPLGLLDPVLRLTQAVERPIPHSIENTLLHHRRADVRDVALLHHAIERVPNARPHVFDIDRTAVVG